MFRYKSGHIYDGDWYQDKKHGVGTMKYSSKEVF